MGFGLAAAPLLALIDPALVPAPILFVGGATAAWTAWQERGEIRWPEVWTALVGRMTGVGVATLLLASLADRSTFMLFFGAMIGLAVFLSVAGWRLAFSRIGLVAMGILSGIMGTITSVGAPPLAIIYQDRPAREARPTLAAFFALGCVASLTGLYLSGWAGWRDLGFAIVMAPVMAAGVAFARSLRGRFDKRYRPALLAVSGVAAAILIARGLA